jgi:acyl-ACP thioesterase
MSSMEVRLHRQSTRLGYFDFDPALRPTALAWWRILQDAAAAHATVLSAATEELRKGGYTWMLSKMAVEIHATPHIGDSLAIETWPSTKLKGARAFRDFRATNDQGELVATGASLWVMVDLASRRPVRVPDAIVALRTDPGYPVPELTNHIDSPENPEPQHFRACWSDCDQNEHVNNAAIVRWAVDALPKSFLETHVLARIEAHYLAEIQLGDAVQVHSAINDTTIHQELITTKTAARVLSHWRKA